MPSSLIEFHKHDPLSDEHRANLEEADEAFYAAVYDSHTPLSKDIKQRMQMRIGDVLKEKRATTASAAAAAAAAAAEEEKEREKVFHDSDGSAEEVEESALSPDLLLPLPDLAPPRRHKSREKDKAQFENYRLMFFMVSRNHNTPSLLWGEQTRLELRNALEAELKSFDQEQRLRGAHCVAWNFQQFSVHYPSLADEMRVGPVYLRHYLEAEESYLRAIESPSHLELFERLFRRVLVNLTSAPRVHRLHALLVPPLQSVRRPHRGV